MNLHPLITFIKIDDLLWETKFKLDSFYTSPKYEYLIKANCGSVLNELKELGIKKDNIHVSETKFDTNYHHYADATAYIIRIKFENEADEAVFIMYMITNRSLN